MTLHLAQGLGLGHSSNTTSQGIQEVLRGSPGKIQQLIPEHDLVRLNQQAPLGEERLKSVPNPLVLGLLSKLLPLSQGEFDAPPAGLITHVGVEEILLPGCLYGDFEGLKLGVDEEELLGDLRGGGPGGPGIVDEDVSWGTVGAHNQG